MFIPQITPLVVLVALLGHHKFSVREAGYQRLAQIVDREKSYPVYPKAGLESKDHEVRTYSRRLDALWRDPLPPGTPYPRITFVPGQPARDEQMEVRHPRTGRFMNWVERQDRYREECKEYAQSMLKSGARRYTVKRMCGPTAHRFARRVVFPPLHHCPECRREPTATAYSGVG